MNTQKQSIGLALLLAGLGVASAAADSSPAKVTVFLTAKGTDQRLARTADLNFQPKLQPMETEKMVFIDPTKQFQTFLGIGGALTDAAAETFYKLPKAKQQEFLKAHFDPVAGLGYTLGRTHINSCDFSSASYTYVANGDRELKTFDIAPDRKYRIPFIKEALAVAGKEFVLYASPWSPPAWMKGNNHMLQGGKLLPEFHDAWANYYVKFINAYEQAGIPIWGLTVQNEPMAKQTWESCIYTAEEERDFVKHHLGPTLVKSGLKDKKLIVWDHNRDLAYHRASTILDDPEAAQYVWGVGFHWYDGGLFNNMKLVQDTYPEVNLIFTEGCNYPWDFAKINEWHWGENYGRSMINDFNSGAVGWTDWNILLDETGGPNHVKNFCYAPVHGDTRNGTLHYMNSYYYIGHFSKFIRPGARRIASSSMAKELLTTAFQNPDGSLAVVVMNDSGQTQPFFLWLGGQAARTESPAHSILTFVLTDPKQGLASKNEVAADGAEIWGVDFFDDFETFNSDHWQDQRLWVNNETQCYVPDNEFGTREVSNGTLKIKVVHIGEKRSCDNFDKHGKKHPDTEYVAGRICSKNKKEFIKGKWTARLKLGSNGERSMFPAWWLLGARNNEPPVQESDENIFWPLTGSGEIDIFEHHGDGQTNQYTTGAIKSLGESDKGDWWSLRTGINATLNEYHEYSVEWEGSDLVYRLDGKEVYRNVGQGDKYPEPMFAILNFAKITTSPMKGEWVMEVDWVKHEYKKKLESQAAQTESPAQSIRTFVPTGHKPEATKKLTSATSGGNR